MEQTRMEQFREGPLVVLVDDDPDMRILVAQWLNQAGIRTIECADAEAFLESLDTTVPDLVCLDLDLPHMSGREALDEVRRRHPITPVIMLTAESSTQSIVDAMRGGALDYLTKPAERELLLSSVRRTLRASEELRRARAESFDDEASYAGVIGRSAPMR
ncbi:MAG: response regulator [Deltaproteobacteria bacterium]|nr:response regulator [Deltaproteobacteria bacterium]